MSEPLNKPRKLPGLADYQRRAAEGVLTSVRNGRDALTVAPTGSGKTPVIARIAAAEVARGKKVLVLTHRKALFQQMVGRASADTEKKRMGEMNWWGGIKPGHIADDSLGGVNQDPGLVVGMVDSVASRLAGLEKYDLTLIDEIQHVSGKSASRQNKGSYAKIIEALPDARLVGLTATTFRGDGDNLHSRIEKADHQVVSIDEARAAGRIVPAETIIGRAPTRSGRTIEELVRLEAEGKLEKSASATLKEERGDGFHAYVAGDWDRRLDRKKTIVFADNVEEVHKLTEEFNRTYGRGTAVSIDGGQKLPEVDKAIKSYESGAARVLISCKMIGEGFDVPDTDAVISTNTSLSRLEMNQYVGRCIRASDGKDKGLFLDYGTASFKHGLIERQHEIQNVDALAACGSTINAARTLGRLAPVKNGDWRAVCGDESSYLIQSVGKKYKVWDIDNYAEKDMGRRRAKGAGSVRRFQPYEHPERGKDLLSGTEVARLLSNHVRREAGYFARLGGLESENYRNICTAVLEDRSGSMDAVSKVSAQGASAEAVCSRRDGLAKALAEPDKFYSSGRNIQKTLENLPSGEMRVREGMKLAVFAFGKCGDMESLPLGLKSEARAANDGMADEEIDKMPRSRLKKETSAATELLTRISTESGSDRLAGVMKNIADPIRNGMSEYNREAIKKKRAKLEVR